MLIAMPHLLIVSATFYEDLADELSRGAAGALAEAGATYDEIKVPGALEIPATIRYALEGGRYDGFVALGTVIRGETSHYDIVCNESARGLTWLSIEHKACIGNGILTVETEEQAWKRADVKRGNKGAAAAEAALALIAAKHQLGVAAR